MDPGLVRFVLPDKAEDILVFLRHNTVDKPAVNSIISYSDFSSHGFSKHAAQEEPTDNRGAHAPAAHHAERDAMYAQRELIKEKTHGKFEKSFVGFKANHPMWEPPEEGQAVSAPSLKCQH